MSNNKSWRLFYLGFAVAGGLFLVTFNGCTNKAAPSGFERPPAPVTVTEAAIQDVPVYIDAIGKTAAREVVSIQPQVSGRIIKIHFTDGANVRKGDIGKGLSNLKKAIEVGGDTYIRYAREDQDFNSIRNIESFKGLIKNTGTV